VFVAVSITETELQLEFVMYTYVFTSEEFCSGDADVVDGTSIKNKIKIVNVEATEYKYLLALIILPPLSFLFWLYLMYFNFSKSGIDSTDS